MKKNELTLITDFIQSHISLQRRKILIENSRHNLRVQYGVVGNTESHNDLVDQRQESIDVLTEVLECVHAIHEEYTKN